MNGAWERVANDLLGEESAEATYDRAERYVNSLIMGPPSPAPGTPPEVIRERAVARLDRLRAFLAFLGNPQQQYRTIHIAGTSGKGSTTVIASSLLASAGYRTGTHVSPYLQVATEKLQIDGRLVDAYRYAALVESMRRSVEEWVALGNERPNYGEFWVAMTYRYFAEEAVDVALIEVGAGGRFDVTNVIDPDVAAITSIGYDHMATLGSTLREIAWHKAGIIKPGSVAVTTVTEPEALPVIADEAQRQRVRLEHVVEGQDFDDVVARDDRTAFRDLVSGQHFHVSLPGAFQARNAALAIAIAREFHREELHSGVIQRGLDGARFPGRMEIVQRVPLVLLDGAHNPEKVRSLAEALRTLFPNRRITLVFGALESKNYREMFELIAPLCHRLVATAPRVLAKPPTTAEDIAILAPQGMAVETVPDPLEAVQSALNGIGDDDLVVVTGSLYLVGNVREHWYPRERILTQGTCWPD